MKKTILLALLLAACGVQKQNPNDGDTIKSNTASGLANTMYATTCIVSKKSYVTFSATSMILKTDTYSNANCTGTPALSTELYFDYQVANANSFDSTDLNLTYLASAITPHTDATTIRLNADSMCGYIDWKTEEKRDVLGTPCTSAGNGEVFKASSPLYTIFKLQGTILQLGNESGGAFGTTPENRHRNLSYIYTRI